MSIQGGDASTEVLPPAALARAEQAIVTLGWPYAAVPGTLLGLPQVVAGGPSDHPLARRVIGCFGLVLGGSAGLFVGGLGATLLAALLHPFVPQLARLVLLSITLFSVALGAIVGRRVLQRETFE
jgi:hypothetical protein